MKSRNSRDKFRKDVFGGFFVMMASNTKKDKLIQATNHLRITPRQALSTESRQKKVAHVKLTWNLRS